MISYLLVFIAVMLVDIMWTQWSITTQKYQTHLAGLYSAGIMLGGSYITLSYVHDGWLIIPAVLGAYVGTAGTIYYHRWRGNHVTSE